MNTLIRLKIPTSAPFIPMVVGDYTALGGCYERDCCFSAEEIFHNSFSNGHTVSKGVERPLTDCFEKRVIQVDDDVLTFYTKDGLSIPYNHRCTPVIMTLRDYYDYLYENYYSWYLNCGVSKSEMLDHWLVYDKPFDRGVFNHIVKRDDYIYNPYIYKLENLITGFVRSNSYKVSRQITDGIIITVSPCR